MKFPEFVRSPIFAGIVPLSMLFIGFLGKDHLLWSCLLAVPLGAVLIGREHINRAEEKRRLRSWPGASLWHALDTAYRSLRKADFAALETPPLYRKDGRNAAVLEALSAVARLTRAFSNLDAQHRVGVNLMFFRSRESVESAEDADAVRSRIAFTIDKTLDGLRGVLDLQIALSVCCTGANLIETPDNALRPMALPVPLKWLSSQSKKLVTPGGAEAFVKPEGHFYVHEVHERWEHKDEYDLSPGVFEKIRKYHQSLKDAGQHVQSFASIVIVDPLQRDGDDHRLGIVNIHSDRAHLFESEDSFVAFKNFLAPILMDIGELLAGRAKR